MLSASEALLLFLPGMAIRCKWCLLETSHLNIELFPKVKFEGITRAFY